MEVEEIELTEAQARELNRATKRVIRTLKKRDARMGQQMYVKKLRTLKNALSEIESGERDSLRLSLGMDGEDREKLIQWLELEKDMMDYSDSTGRDELDGRKLNALENGIEALKEPEIVDVEG